MDGLYIDGKRLNLVDKDEVRREVLLTTQELDNLQQQVQAKARAGIFQQQVFKAVANDPALANSLDLVAVELAQIPDDALGDPYGEKKLATAIERVKGGLNRLDSMTIAEQRGQHQAGLTLTPDGRIIEGESLGNPAVEERIDEPADASYAEVRQARAANIKKTYARTGKA